MYNLLIKKGLNEFTIVQARDELVKETDRFKDMNEARKYVYRQVSSLVTKGYLEVKGSGRHKRYSKTELCDHITFVEKSEIKIRPKRKAAKTTKIETFNRREFLSLEKERNQYQGELSISLAEVEEYKVLIERFPDKKELLHPMISSAKERSATMLGKVNALTAVLAALRLEGNTIC